MKPQLFSVLLVCCLLAAAKAQAEVKVLQPILPKPGMVAETRGDVLDPMHLPQGNSGRLRGPLHVKSITDATNCLIFFSEPHFDGRGSFEYYEHHFVVVEGFSTNNLAAGDEVSLGAAVIVSGTTECSTAGGGTVMNPVVKPVFLTPEQIKVRAEEAKREQERIQQEQAAAAEMARVKKAEAEAYDKARWRTWTIEGEEVYARFNGLINDQVILLKEDKTKLRVPLDNLSKEDRRWIEDRRENAEDAIPEKRPEAKRQTPRAPRVPKEHKPKHHK